MAQKLLIIGESGSGKTCSIRNCNPETTAIVSPEKESLPFGKKAQKYPGKFDMLCNQTDARQITKFMKDEVAKGKKLIIVDDFQYILAIPYMNRIKETGWDKYNDFGSNYFEIIEVCKELPDDVVVAYMSHGETLDTGLFTVKLIGKLLREKITIEGLFTVVLRTGVNEGKYYFYTQNSGKDTTKSPLGMFPAYAIDNDLEYVADKIRNFYEVGEYKSDDDMQQADQAVASDLAQPDSNGRRSRARGNAAAKSENQENTDAPVEQTEQSEPKKRRSRSTKTHDEVVAENQQKQADYMAECDKAVSDAFPDKDEVPYDEAAAVADTVPKPELETPPRRTRKERKAAEQAAPVNDGTDNTDSETITLAEDTYFFRPSDGNYLMKHKGETVDVIVGGVRVLEQITKEQFNEGGKAIAQGNGSPNPVDGAMNPPVDVPNGRSRRTRRTR
jgi:hypothetical protein